MTVLHPCRDAFGLGLAALCAGESFDTRLGAGRLSGDRTIVPRVLMLFTAGDKTEHAQREETNYDYAFFHVFYRSF